MRSHHCETQNNPNCIAVGISRSVCINHLWPVVAGGGGMKDEALKLALEALEKISRTHYHIETPPIESLEEQMRRIADKAITAIKQARSAPVQSCYCPNCEAMGKELAALKAQPAPVQEPVAYLCENAVGHKYFRWKKPSSEFKPIALYTTPPAQRQWVGLTEQEALDCFSPNPVTHSKNVEAKLKEKNT